MVMEISFRSAFSLHSFCFHFLQTFKFLRERNRVKRILSNSLSWFSLGNENILYEILGPVHVIQFKKINKCIFLKGKATLWLCLYFHQMSVTILPLFDCLLAQNINISISFSFFLNLFLFSLKLIYQIYFLFIE